MVFWIQHMQNSFTCIISFHFLQNLSVYLRLLNDTLSPLQTHLFNMIKTLHLKKRILLLEAFIKGAVYNTWPYTQQNNGRQHFTSQCSVIDTRNKKPRNILSIAKLPILPHHVMPSCHNMVNDGHFYKRSTAGPIQSKFTVIIYTRKTTTDSKATCNI